MPIEEQTLEQLKKAIGEAQTQPAKEPSPEEIAIFYMVKTLEVLRRGKPEVHNELARCYAVTITEMEKVFAYFKTFVVYYIDSVDNDQKT